MVGITMKNNNNKVKNAQNNAQLTQQNRYLMDNTIIFESKIIIKKKNHKNE